MGRTPRMTAREVVQYLKQHGFIEEKQKGSHRKLFNPHTRRMTIVPIHAGEIISVGLLKAIEKQSGVVFPKK